MISRKLKMDILYAIFEDNLTDVKKLITPDIEDFYIMEFIQESIHHENYNIADYLISLKRPGAGYGDLMKIVMRNCDTGLLQYCIARKYTGASYETDPLYVAIMIDEYDIAHAIAEDPDCNYNQHTFPMILVYAMKNKDYGLLSFLESNDQLTADNIYSAECLDRAQ